MAGSTGKKASSSNRRSTGTRSGSTKKKTTKSQAGQDSVLFHEIGLIILFVAMVILFCCNFGIIGPVGDAISGFLFGVLGLTAYAAPVLIFLAAAFWFANEGNPNAVRKLSAGIVLFVMLGVVADLITGTTETSGGYSLSAIYETCRDFKAGGGIIAGSIRSRERANFRMDDTGMLPEQTDLSFSSLYTASALRRWNRQPHVRSWIIRYIHDQDGEKDGAFSS